MHPTIGNEIMTARITERHQRADAARLAAAAKQGRRALRQRGTRRLRPYPEHTAYSPGRRYEPLPLSYASGRCSRWPPGWGGDLFGYRRLVPLTRLG